MTEGQGILVVLVGIVGLLMIIESDNPWSFAQLVGGTLVLGSAGVGLLWATGVLPVVTGACS